MKIGFIASNLSKGGAQRVTSILASYLAEKGHTVSVYLIKSNDISYPISEKVNCVNLVPEKSNKIKTIMKRIKLLRKNVNDDVLISFLHVYPIIVKFGKKCKLIASERNDPSKNYKGKPIGALLRRIEYLSADEVVFQTEYARHYFGGKIEKKGTIIPNPIESSLPEPFVGERDKTIVGVGRLRYQKNFELLIRAFALVSKRFADYTLHIYGQGEMLDSLIELSDKLGVKDRVFFEGFVDNATDKINSASVYVLSSRYEGISNAMLEALCMGVPTVSTDCGGGCARQYIKNGENGFIVPLDDEKEMARAICDVLSNKEIQHIFSTNSMLLKEELSAEKICVLWEKIIER